MDESAWLDLVLARADELRRAGVLSVQVGDCSVGLAAYEAPASKDDIVSDGQAEPTNVFDDPASYSNGIVPGFRIEKLELDL